MIRSRFINCLDDRLKSHCRVTIVPADIVQLPDDNEEEPPRSTRGRGRASTTSRSLSKRAPSSRMSNPPSKPVVQELGGSPRVGVSFAVPLSTAQPLMSTAQAIGPTGQPQTLIPPAVSPTPASIEFTLHHVPEDQTGVAKEAMIQAGLMMDRLKVVYESSKAAYDASSALQANVQVNMIVS